MNANKEYLQISLECDCEDIKALSEALSICAYAELAYDACGREAMRGIHHSLGKKLEEMERIDRNLED